MRKPLNQLGNKMFIINCKNYDEIAGDKIIKIALFEFNVTRLFSNLTFPTNK